MFEQDYIMREVQKLTQVLSVIIGLKKEKKFDEALNEADKACVRFFEENLETIHKKSFNEIINLCVSDGQFSADLAFALADLINEEAEIRELKSEKQRATRQYESAMKLYQRALAEKEAVVPVDVLNKMKRLKNKINGNK